MAQWQITYQQMITDGYVLIKKDAVEQMTADILRAYTENEYLKKEVEVLEQTIKDMREELDEKEIKND
jgi:cell division protein FtsB